MLFVQFRFLIFFLVVFTVHWALRGLTARKVWLLAAGHFFYACLFLGGPDSATADVFPPVTFCLRLMAGQPLPTGWWFPIVLWASTAMDYVVGLGIARSTAEGRRRAWLLVSLAMNLGVLGFFKYYNFGVESVHSALAWFGLHTSRGTLAIFLPYGISFYTFQSMSYSIDVYRRRLEAVRSFLDLAFFISFFPPLVAGPIVRAMTFLLQVFTARSWARVEVRACLVLFFIGFVKKALVSETVAPLADLFFTAPGRYDTLSAFLGVGFYAVQIYCDFSGYTDMAIACAGLLGYQLTPNFAFPYFASSITEFWRRWHISLSTWLRDYLYIPLGGNRGSLLFTWRNLMLTMLLGGLWHGASWNFVIWGGLHGAALVVHREWVRHTARFGELLRRVMAWLGVPLTFYWILITWVFFRAQPIYDEKTHAQLKTGFAAASDALHALCFSAAKKAHPIARPGLWLGLFAGLALVHFANSRGWFSTWWRRLPAPVFAALLGLGTAVVVFFLQAKFKPFIYFQF
ncbi:MAG TPA: MBOAT family O-acyltransferase [Chthoniobacteraceae bacterium]|jgi:alginate O-acetyltransferase complex protein AlgI|nr:MBOAT family O-acyltransferase [Chthoniobacteraceae bacterium]